MEVDSRSFWKDGCIALWTYLNRLEILELRYTYLDTYQGGTHICRSYIYWHIYIYVALTKFFNIYMAYSIPLCLFSFSALGPSTSPGFIVIIQVIVFMNLAGRPKRMWPGKPPMGGRFFFGCEEMRKWSPKCLKGKRAPKIQGFQELLGDFRPEWWL